VEDGISRESGKTAVYRLRISGTGDQKMVASSTNAQNIAAYERRTAQDVGLRRDQLN
jgi:hypothetical protein